jgi:hypothetical protein
VVVATLLVEPPFCPTVGPFRETGDADHIAQTSSGNR